MSVSVNVDAHPPLFSPCRRRPRSFAVLALVFFFLGTIPAGAQQRPRSAAEPTEPKASVTADQQPQIKQRQFRRIDVAAPRDDRLRTTPTAWWWYHGVSAQFIGERLQQNRARIVDLEMEGTSTDRFSVVMVKNEGAYAAGWWWYTGLRGVGAAAAKLNEHEQARLIDLEAVEVDYNGGKSLVFAVVMVNEPATRATTWWRDLNSSLDAISSSIDQNGARLVDLEYNHSSVVPGRYGAVLLANQGADARAWWWYLGVSPDVIAARLQQNNARLVDIDRLPDGTFNVVMVAGQGEAWWWYYGLTADALAGRLTENGARLIDIEPYFVGGQKRFAAIMIKN